MAFDYRGYAARVRQQESTNDYGSRVRANKAGKRASSASGAYGFIDKTWSRYGNTKYSSAYLAPAAEQDAAFDRFTAANQQELANAGIAVTPGSTYAAHFAGSGGAKAIYSAAPGSSLKSVLGAKAYNANKALFDQVKTVDGFKAWADKKMGAKAAPTNPQEAVDAAPFGNVAAALGAESQVAEKRGPFETMFSDIGDALGGIGNAFSGVTGETTGAVNSTAADGKAKEQGFFGEATGLAQVGSLVGGYFGGAPGAIAGGLLGQGVSKVFGGSTALNGNGVGLAGGVGRVLDGIFGGIGGGLNIGPSATGTSMSDGSRDSLGRDTGGLGSSGTGRSYDGGRTVSDNWDRGSTRSAQTGGAYRGSGGRGTGEGSVRGESSHS